MEARIIYFGVQSGVGSMSPVRKLAKSKVRCVLLQVLSSQFLLVTHLEGGIGLPFPLPDADGRLLSQC